QTIRTLMERVALYRRALAPMMLAAGVFGLAAGAVGWFVPLESATGFFALWLLTAAVVIVTCFLLIRRQAIVDAEPFWTPPTRRVAAAACPAVFVAALVTLFKGESETWIAGGLLCVWLVCHGLALHAAGFFMPRGIRWFGWGFVLFGIGLAMAIRVFPVYEPSFHKAHLVMGGTFGLGHLAYGLYLRATGRNCAA
ncbi:MAG TPA: hypothetical protein VMB21_19480, partial [Candidatus Limnocylindria bacterium]|nr:hypothetical protein [Candidatus Limnocylindria bacterium]